MGQKVNPIGIRLGIVKDWTSTWYASTKDYPDLLNNDLAVREFLKKKLANASVSRIQINRPARNAHITIHTARPGVVIGKKGGDIDKLRTEVAERMRFRRAHQHRGDPQARARRPAGRRGHRAAARAAHHVPSGDEACGAGNHACWRQGIKVNIAGRLNGAEIARSEWYREGRVPLHTLRADIDYGFAEARTTYGIIGVKVWVFRGEIIGKAPVTGQQRQVR